MPGGYGDITQRTIIALESQGADALTIIGDGISELQKRQRDLTDAFESGSVASAAYVKSMQSLEAEVTKLKGMYDEAGNSFDSAAALQKKLGEMEKQSARDTQEGVAASTATRRQGTEAIVEHIAKTREEIAAEEAARVAGIKATGDRAQAYAREERALEELNAELARNQQAREKEAAATQWVTRQTAELSDALQGLAQSEREASTYSFFADSGRNAIGKTSQELDALKSSIIANAGITSTAAKSQAELSKQLDASGRASRNSGFGFLAFSHAMQDAQYGTAAVLNNIPLIVQGMGGSAGLAGAVMLVGLGFEVLKPHMEDFGRRLNILRDPLRDLQGGLAGMEERLTALGSKPFKVAADYTALREMKEELDIAKRAIAEWEALKASRTSTQEESKKILDEGIKEGGGAKAVEDSIVEIKKRQGTYGAGSAIHGQIAVAQAREANARQISASARKNLGEWAAAPSDYLADQARAEVAKLRNDLDVEARQKIAQTVASASKSPAALKELGDYYKANADVFKKHGVTDTFGSALENASPEAIGENKKIDEDYEESIRKTDLSIGQIKEAYGGRRARTKKALDERAGEIKGHAGRVGPGFEEALEQALLGRVASGQGVGAASGPLAGQLGKRLNDIVPEDIRDEVADAIMDKVREKVANQLQEETAKRGVSPARAAARLGQVARDKFGASETADQRRNEAPQRQAQQQAKREQTAQAHAGTEFKKMLAGLVTLGEINKRQQAEILAANGFAVEAAQIINQINAKLNSHAKFGRRPAMQVRGFMPMGGG